MSFELSCPACNQMLLLEDEHVGCSVECPVCRHEFIVEKAQPAVMSMPLQIKRREEPAESPEDSSVKLQKTADKKKKKAKRKPGSVTKSHSNLTDVGKRTLKKIKLIIVLVVLGIISYWGYSIYKDIYWSIRVLESIYAALISDDSRVVYRSVDDLKIENKSLRSLGLPDNEKVVKMLNQYIFLFVLSQDKMTNVKTLIDDIPESDYKVFVGDIVAMCYKCDGGFAVCKYCKGTRKCHICNGSGGTSSIGVDGESHYTKCRTDCAYCSSPVRCSYCHGNIFLYNRKEIKKIVPSYKEELVKNVQNKIKEYKSFAYIGKQFLDRFFALFSKSNIKNNQSEQQAQSTKTLSLNKKNKSRGGQVADVALIKFSASDGKSEVFDYFLSLNCTHCNRRITADCGARKIICPYCKNMVILKNQNPLACGKQR